MSQRQPGPSVAGELLGSELLADAVVLVVDDNEANVVLLERLLRRVGLAGVHSVTDARQAVARCVELDPDLVLLDLHMPHVDGFEVLAQMQELLPKDTFLPVIVLTGDTTTGARERALDAGAKDFLTKPFDRVEVIQRVRNLLEMRALYRSVQSDNQLLRAEAERRARAHRVLERARVAKRERIEAVLNGESLRMVFQPIADLRTGRTVGVEALARFDTEPARTPDVWFAEASDVGLGVELELCAITAAVAQLPDIPTDVLLSVNASPATANQHMLLDLAEGYGARLVLELTEHERIVDYPALVASLDRLRALGVRIAVDDAGAGYAGLQHILTLQPDIIKLDLELTRGVDADPVRHALAASLVAFAQDTGATLIAEGIETSAELEALRLLGVPWGQGYHLGRPAVLPAPSAIDVTSPGASGGASPSI